MKKVLLAIAENKLPESAFEFISRLNEINPLLVTGIFLREIIYMPDPAFSYYGMVSGAGHNAEAEAIVQKDIQRRTDWFEKACQKKHIEYRVHNDTDDLIVEALVKETRFADLLVVNAEAFYQLSELTEPEGYLKSILHLAECPVLIVPQKFSFPENVVLAYDGSASSVYAIKQFSYILNELCNKDVMVVHEAAANSEKIPDEALIEELAARHFNTPNLLMFHKHMMRLAEWVKVKQSAMLVTGSYSRSNFSEMFRKSFVSKIIRDHKMPVFIAHR